MGLMRKYKHFILLITVPVLLLFMSNSIMNRHSHLVRGYIYYHAHPFKSEPSSQNYPLHSHTDAELLVLDLLGNVELIIFLILAALLPVPGINILIQRTRTRIIAVFDTLTCSLRGPPRYT